MSVKFEFDKDVVKEKVRFYEIVIGLLPLIKEAAAPSVNIPSQRQSEE
ncbi:hypothetical protein [uncultured Nostoc sp.]